MIEAITFDFWNTLFKIPEDTRASSRRISKFCAAMFKRGYEVDEQDVRAAFRDCTKHANFCQMNYGRDITPRGHIDFILERLNLNVDSNTWDQAYHDYTTAILEFPPLVNDSVKETLPTLAKKYKLAVICNTGITPGSILRQFIKNNGLEEYFQMLVFSDEVGWAKPNPQIFHHTLKGIRVLNSQAAHIGDDAITDIIGAKKAGMQAVWLAPRAESAVPECDYHVRSVRELITLF
ncbi:MAG: HAD family hydrolase [Syntrophomonadaceae bacterium]